MKSYLNLVPISAKVHRRQNLMTILCIIISVTLVATVFSMSDMMIKAERTSLMKKHGNWQINLSSISEETAKEIAADSHVRVTGWYDVINYDADENFYLEGKKASLYGVDEAYINKLHNGTAEGAFPKNSREAMLSTNAKNSLGLQLGDEITVHTPGGTHTYTVSGFGQDDDGQFKEQNYLMGVFLTHEAYENLLQSDGIVKKEPCFYVQFKKHVNINRTINYLKKEYALTDDQIDENAALNGLMGLNFNETVSGFYQIAVILFIIVLVAGIFMIAGSMNSNVLQRTRFFGMMRCIGASRQQIIRLVRLEALNWCKISIPIGIGINIFTTWVVCAALRYGIGAEFSDLPLFSFSLIGIILGSLVGLFTVLLAAHAPAKRAANVPPIVAASGNAYIEKKALRPFKLGHSKIETALGRHHALSAKKNMILMIGSFSLSIILILIFFVLLNFAKALLPSLRPWQPNASICAYANENHITKDTIKKLESIPGVTQVYASSYKEHIPAISNQGNIEYVNIVSYDDYMFDCAKESLIDGKIKDAYNDNNTVLTIFNKKNPIKTGDKIKLKSQKKNGQATENEVELKVEGTLSDGLFQDDIIIICSQKTFQRLTGISNYGMVNMKLSDQISDESMRKIEACADKNDIFSDTRQSSKDSNSTYFATRLISYAFLTLTGMITVFYMINSISMSVTAKMRQYGMMLAIGMDGKQLTRMIASESFTYALFGLLFGFLLGLPISAFIHSTLITSHFGIRWSVPYGLMGIIILLVLVFCGISIYGPAKKLRNMSVINVIANED